MTSLYHLKPPTFNSALDIIDVTSEQPIEKKPFVAFKVVDKTAPSRNPRYEKKYVAYVNANSDESSCEMWGTPPVAETSFHLRSKGPSIKPDALHDVAVGSFR